MPAESDAGGVRAAEDSRPPRASTSTMTSAFSGSRACWAKPGPTPRSSDRSSSSSKAASPAFSPASSFSVGSSRARSWVQSAVWSWTRCPRRSCSRSPMPSAPSPVSSSSRPARAPRKCLSSSSSSVRSAPSLAPPNLPSSPPSLAASGSPPPTPCSISSATSPRWRASPSSPRARPLRQRRGPLRRRRDLRGLYPSRPLRTGVPR